MQVTESKISNYHANLVPFGSLDIERAISVAQSVGEDEYWASERVQEALELGIKLNDIDPVYVVYDAIFQEAKSKIYNLTGVDIENEFKSNCQVYGNFLDTQFDYSSDFADELKELLVSSGIKEEQLSSKTTFFLEELEIELPN